MRKEVQAHARSFSTAKLRRGRRRKEKKWRAVSSRIFFAFSSSFINWASVRQLWISFQLETMITLAGKRANVAPLHRSLTSNGVFRTWINFYLFSSAAVESYFDLLWPGKTLSKDRLNGGELMEETEHSLSLFSSRLHFTIVETCRHIMGEGKMPDHQW